MTEIRAKNDHETDLASERKKKIYKNISYKSSSSIPEFVLLPPQEEHKSEPCLVWIPDEYVKA
jgi:hypothetical protein